jgi:hypothetical protein
MNFPWWVVFLNVYGRNRYFEDFKNKQILPILPRNWRRKTLGMTRPSGGDLVESFTLAAADRLLRRAPEAITEAPCRELRHTRNDHFLGIRDRKTVARTSLKASAANEVAEQTNEATTTNPNRIEYEKNH